jgi:hypothetical protein
MPGQTASRVVLELECGIMVYPPQRDGEPWRAVWVENGRRRFREAVTEEKLAGKLEMVTERLRADAGGRGPASTPIPSAACASGSWPR